MATGGEGKGAGETEESEIMNIEEQRALSTDLRRSIRSWTAEIKKLNDAVRAAGPLLGHDVDAVKLGEVADKKSRMLRLRCDIDDATDRLADVDNQLREMEGDLAEEQFLSAIDQLKINHTCEAEALLLNAGMMLVHYQRIKHSSIALREKIRRALNPARVRGVKVSDCLDDLRNYVRRRAA